MAPRQRVLQILVKYGLFEIGEKTRLIHLEYRQKARSAENRVSSLAVRVSSNAVNHSREL